MSVPHSSALRRRQRGVARLAFSVLLFLLLLAGAFTFAWWRRMHADAPPETAIAAETVAGAVVRPAAASSVGALLRDARAAVAAQRLLTPAGDNAFEDYLAVRQQPSGRAVADDALRELFPYAADQVGATIRDGRIDEAQRQLALLARADPSNYTLTLLRDQLAERQRVAVAPSVAPSATVPKPPAPMATLAAATALPPSADRADRHPAVPAAEATPSPAAPTPTRVEPPPPEPVATAVAPSATPPVLLRRVEPYYPQSARRTRREGWVELAFTVTAQGRVDAVRVLEADPGKVFDLAATSAVRRWVFAPATRDGKPVAAELRQRLDFRL
jgi:protein TonB